MWFRLAGSEGLASALRSVASSKAFSCVEADRVGLLSTAARLRVHPWARSLVHLARARSWFENGGAAAAVQELDLALGIPELPPSLFAGLLRRSARLLLQTDRWREAPRALARATHAAGVKPRPKASAHDLWLSAIMAENPETAMHLLVEAEGLLRDGLSRHTQASAALAAHVRVARAGLVLRSAHDHAVGKRQVLQLVKAAAHAAAEAFGDVHPQALQVLLQGGRVLLCAGLFHDAANVFSVVVKRKPDLYPGYPFLWRVHADLAAAMGEMGAVRGAREHFRLAMALCPPLDAFPARLKALAEATCRLGLARLLARWTPQLDQAHEALDRAVRVIGSTREAEVGGRDLDWLRAACRREAAELLVLQGQPARALEMCQRAGDNNLPPTSLTPAASLHCLGECLAALGRVADAVQAYRKELNMRAKLQGKWHPELGRALHCWGAALVSVDPADVQGLSALQQGSAIYQLTLCPRHPFALSCKARRRLSPGSHGLNRRIIMLSLVHSK